jgi:S1-C subfamily serine protease
MRFIITASMGKPGESMKLLCALVLVIASATAEAAETSAGSGVVIGTQGEILTNSHVVEDCQKITVQFPSKDSETAVLVARDQRNDLAVVRTSKPLASVAAFRDGAPVRAGDTVVALGYPLSGLLASTTNVSVGNVSALAGLGDDSRYLQISAPVQPGNSGGPLLDASGHLVGIVTAKLNAARVARVTGDIPQNVNFALKSEVHSHVAWRRPAAEWLLSDPSRTGLRVEHWM